MKEMYVKITGISLTMCLLAAAFFFACGFGDETAPLMRNPTSGTISSPCNFTGDVTVNGETLVGTTGSASIVTLGTVTTGTWGATTIAVNKGGTGATTAAGATTALSAASISSGTLAAMPLTNTKKIGDIYIDTGNANAYMCCATGADTTGWKQINN